MKICRPIVSLLVLALLAESATAQGSDTVGGEPPLWQEAGAPGAAAGTIEFGIFGQLTYLGLNGRFDFSGTTVGFDSRGVMAFGARLGLFLTPVWSVEVDAVGGKPEAEGGRKVNFRALAFRANYNFPVVGFGDRTSALLGAGFSRVEYSGGEPRATTAKWGVSGIAGARLHVADPVVLRGDVVADYIPSALNAGLRLGVGVLFGSGGFGGRDRSDRPRTTTVAAPTLPPAEPEPPPLFVDDENRAAALAGVDTIPLSRSIFFDYDRVEIRPDAVPILEAKVRWLQANPRLMLRIEGHADDRGQDEYNLSLSQRRAAETQAWLAARGISEDRLPIVGYGEEYRLCMQEPMTDACHQLNRRADFRILRVGATRLIPPR